jgi:hypothetical protein
MNAECSSRHYGSSWQALIFWELPLGTLRFAQQDSPIKQKKEQIRAFSAYSA